MAKGQNQQSFDMLLDLTQAANKSGATGLTKFVAVKSGVDYLNAVRCDGHLASRHIDYDHRYGSNVDGQHTQKTLQRQ